MRRGERREECHEIQFANITRTLYEYSFQIFNIDNWVNNTFTETVLNWIQTKAILGVLY